MSDFTITEILIALLISIFGTMSFLEWKVVTNEPVVKGAVKDEVHVWWEEGLYGDRIDSRSDVLGDEAVRKLTNREAIDYVIP